jgi:hypothetical protein
LRGRLIAGRSGAGAVGAVLGLVAAARLSTQQRLLGALVAAAQAGVPLVAERVRHPRAGRAQVVL